MGLTVAGYLELLIEEAGPVEVPHGPCRLVASSTRIRECAESALAGVSRLTERADEPEAPRARRVEVATDHALELSSYLYVAGAPHPVWRWWSALAGLGFALQNRFADAATYGAVAGDWEFVHAVRSRPPGPSYATPYLWSLLTGGDAPSVLPDDDLDQAWGTLITAVRAGDHPVVETSLRQIVEWWWEEDEGDWVNFHPHSYPDFDAPVCAAVAMAKHHGYRPRSLSPDIRRYIEAGLADGYPEKLSVARLLRAE